MDYDVLDSVRQALATGDEGAVRQRLAGMRPADLADIVERLDAEERQRVFVSLPDENAADVLRELDEAVAAAVVQALPPERASRLLGDIPHDDAADVLQDLPDEAADALLAGMEVKEAQELRELLEYPEHTAGGRMVTDFVTVSQDAVVAEVIAGLRAHPPSAETAYYLYVCDAHGRLAGVVSLRDLVIASPEARIGEIMARDVVRVRADADQEEAADLVARYDLLAVPVVDAQDRVVGVITVDDVLEVLEEEATEDILRLSSGAGETPQSTPPPLRARLPRLAVALAAGLAAALVVGAYCRNSALSAPFLLFIPMALAVSEVVTGQVMAAVAGSVRRDAPASRVGRAVARELFTTAGLAAGAGLLLALLLGQWQRLGRLGLTLGIAVFLVAMAASLVGALVPMLSQALRRDPSAVPVSLAAALADTAALAVYTWTVVAFR